MKTISIQKVITYAQAFLSAHETDGETYPNVAGVIAEAQRELDLIVSSDFSDYLAALNADSEIVRSNISLLKANASLRGFANELFEVAGWPEGGDIDGFDFQDAAVKHGLLIPEQRIVPCCAECACAATADNGEEVTCYRPSEILTEKASK